MIDEEDIFAQMDKKSPKNAWRLELLFCNWNVFLFILNLKV